MNILSKCFCAMLVTAVAAFITGCATDPDYTKSVLLKGIIDVAPAPDIHGASKELDSHSNNFKVRGGVRMDDEKDRVGGMTLTNDLDGDVSGSSALKKYEKADLAYVIETFPVYGSFAYIHKFGLLELGTELGFDDEFYLSGMFGFNTEYLEAGISAFVGAHISNVNTKYEIVEWNNCDWLGSLFHQCEVIDRGAGGKHADRTIYIVGSGVYASAYYDRLSLTYSGSMQYYENPYQGGEDGSVNASTKENFLPIIFTNHLSLGFNILDHIILRAGVTNVVGNFKGWHITEFGGAEFLW